jgi:hypothetical protein
VDKNSFLLLAFALNVGITGHRTLPAKEIINIEKIMVRILELIKNTSDKFLKETLPNYSNPFHLYRMISPLAEGADRIAAYAALKCNYELFCPLPFSKSEYEKDFIATQSKNEFNYLLSKATSVFKVEGDAINKNEAYLKVGEYVLKNCNILLTVWDGIVTENVGGTSSITQKAIEQNIPVVWINSILPHEIRIIERNQEFTFQETKLKEILSRHIIK